MPLNTTANNSTRELNEQQLDTSQISDVHEWDIYAQSDISFRHIVEENPDPRSDASRYKLVADINIEGARSSFSRACSSTTLFKIPNTIMCDRTFARDAYEAYYIDAMYHYLCQLDGELRVEDIPLLKFRLHSRYFCAFSRRPIYFNEHYERRRLGSWVPGDSPDLEYFNDLQKVGLFPMMETWVRMLSQPTALPVPLPFVIYYFHTELRNAERIPSMADSERVKRLRFCLQHEYCILYIATWWNELFYGGRAYVLKREVIDMLNDRCGNVPDIAGRPAQAIIERMRMFSDMPEHTHNWMCFADRSMERSTFIFAVKGVGVHDHSMSSGRRLWCRRDHRSVTVAPYSCKTHRRLGLLDERLAGPDLEDVPGLLSLVTEQDWGRYNSLRVSDMLHNLVALHTDTRCKLDDARQKLRDGDRCFDDLKKDYATLREDLYNAERSLDSRGYQLEAANNLLNSTLGKLDDAHREIDDLRKKRIEPSQVQRFRGSGTPVVVNERLRSPEYFPLAHNDTDVNIAGKHGRSGASSEERTTPTSNTEAPSAIAQVKPSVPTVSFTTENTIAPVTERRNGQAAELRTKDTAEICERVAAGNRSTPSSPKVPRRRLPKIKPGYFFYPMPKPTRPRSAQTQLLKNSALAGQESMPAANLSDSIRGQQSGSGSGTIVQKSNAPSSGDNGASGGCAAQSQSSNVDDK